LKGGNQGADFATGFKAAQGADGALAGFTFFVAERLRQLVVAPIPGLGDHDQDGIECGLISKL
jgi:hypothetical protein